jgi:hypothetical protein
MKNRTQMAQMHADLDGYDALAPLIRNIDDYSFFQEIFIRLRVTGQLHVHATRNTHPRPQLTIDFCNMAHFL